MRILFDTRWNFKLVSLWFIFQSLCRGLPRPWKAGCSTNSPQCEFRELIHGNYFKILNIFCKSFVSICWSRDEKRVQVEIASAQCQLQGILPCCYHLFHHLSCIGSPTAVRPSSEHCTAPSGSGLDLVSPAALNTTYGVVSTVHGVSQQNFTTSTFTIAPLHKLPSIVLYKL